MTMNVATYWRLLVRKYHKYCKSFEIDFEIIELYQRIENVIKLKHIIRDLNGKELSYIP